VANTPLSPTIITREALKYLHQNLNFIGNINRQYDDSFANGGASPSGKIGPNLTIRMPNEFSVRTGATLQVQDVAEQSKILTVSTQKGVDINFSSTELTLTIDEFGPRYLKPAMARLATEMEKDAIDMINDVGNFIDHDNTALAFLHFAEGRQKLNEALAPDDGQRVAFLCPTHETKMLDAMKGQFNPQQQIGDIYRKGKLGTVLNADFYSNPLYGAHTTGTAVTGDTLYNVTAVSADGLTLTVDTGATTFKRGDAITIGALGTCNAVHPETKTDLGYLKTFTVTADVGANATSIPIYPPLLATGVRRTVLSAAAANAAVNKLGGTANAVYTESCIFHPDAFTFVSADLVDVSKFGAWGARDVMDNISMRIARQYDITNDKVPCRIDVLYGYKAIRPELAVRLHADG
jgi:hypothetical protein